MGTNFFLVNRGTLRIHVGKKSAGWKFMWRGYDDTSFSIKSKDDYLAILASGSVWIVDEHGLQYQASEFLNRIAGEQTDRSGDLVDIDGNGFTFAEFQ